MEQYFSACMDCELVALAERHYVPVVKDGFLELTKARSRKVLAIAYADVPGERCGSALRIGYTGPQDNDKAIYRLKVIGKDRKFFTLPLLYVLKDGVFVFYEEEGAETNKGMECFRCKKIMYAYD